MPDFKRINDLAKQASSEASFVFFCDVANCIGIELNCSIRIQPSTEPEFRGLAQTWTRIVHVKTTWPEQREFNAQDHTIFFDRNLPQAQAARLIAHELYHVWQHNPANPAHLRDPDTGAVEYGDKAEKAADLFSVCLLRHHSFKPGWIPPMTAKDFVDFLDNESGWPDWFTRDEVIDFVKKLYQE